MYRQGLPVLDLYMECDTERTPCPDRYFLFLGGVIIGESRTLKAAQAQYQAQKTALADQVPPRSASDHQQTLVRETQADYLDRAEAHWARSGQYRARGRPGRRR